MKNSPTSAGDFEHPRPPSGIPAAKVVSTPVDHGPAAGPSLSKPVLVALMNGYTEGLSGGDVWFMEVARRWDQAELIIITSALGKAACLSYGVKARFLLTTNERHFARLTRTYLLRTIRAVQLLSRLDHVDILHSTSDAPPDVVPAFWLHVMQKDVVWVQRVCHVVLPKKGRLLAWATQVIMHILVRCRADTILAISETLRNQLMRRHLPGARLAVTYPGLDTPHRPERSNDVSGTPTLDRAYDALFVGRLHRSKGVFDLPKIWATVVNEIPNAHLGIVGHADELQRQQLQAEIERHSLSDRIEICGFVSDSELELLYCKAKLFLFPSHEEGYGMVIGQALVRGLPVISWRLPSYREHFDGYIIQVAEGDLYRFSEEAVKLLRDDALRNSRAAGASWMAAQRTWDQVAQYEWQLLRYESEEEVHIE